MLPILRSTFHHLHNLLQAEKGLGMPLSNTVRTREASQHHETSSEIEFFLHHHPTPLSLLGGLVARVQVEVGPGQGFGLPRRRYLL